MLENLKLKEAHVFEDVTTEITAEALLEQRKNQLRTMIELPICSESLKPLFRSILHNWESGTTPWQENTAYLYKRDGSLIVGPIPISEAEEIYEKKFVNGETLYIEKQSQSLVINRSPENNTMHYMHLESGVGACVFQFLFDTGAGMPGISEHDLTRLNLPRNYQDDVIEVRLAGEL